MAENNGGGAGGGSAQTVVQIPAFLLPDVLFIQVGAGGAGSTTNGGAGVLSYVAIAPDTTPSNVIAVSGAAGAAGNSSATGGAAGTVAVIGSMPLAGLGQYTMVAGQAGTTGGLGNGTSQSIPVTGLLCMGGTSGSGSSGTSGGGITSIANSWLSQQAPIAAASGQDGSGGVTLWKPFFSFPGLGGGFGVKKGGNGGHGSGGGGGGIPGSTGGSGGNGIVVIACF